MSPKKGEEEVEPARQARMIVLEKPVDDAHLWSLQINADHSHESLSSS